MCIVNSTGPLISYHSIYLEGSVVVTRFLVFMRKFTNNKKRLTCESCYYFNVFIFLFTANDPIADKNDDIHGEYIKQ